MNEILNGYDFSSKQAEGIYSTPSARSGFLSWRASENGNFTIFNYIYGVYYQQIKGQSNQADTRTNLLKQANNTEKHPHVIFLI